MESRIHSKKHSLLYGTFLVHPCEKTYLPKRKVVDRVQMKE
jgi:hypothetical protein